MELNKHKKNIFIKKNDTKSECTNSNKVPKILSNIEAFELGKFPENLIEKIELPNIKTKNYVESELKPNHSEILKDRETSFFVIMNNGEVNMQFTMHVFQK